MNGVFQCLVLFYNLKEKRKRPKYMRKRGRHNTETDLFKCVLACFLFEMKSTLLLFPPNIYLARLAKVRISQNGIAENVVTIKKQTIEKKLSKESL